MRYSRILVIAAFFSILPILASAQMYQYATPPATPSLMLGVRGGLGIANESTPAYTNFTVGSRTGFLIGGQLDYWFSPNWALSAQALYDQKGDQLTGYSPDNGYPETDNFQLNYLEVPVLAKVAFSAGSVKPYLFAGPSIGFLLSATDEQVQSSLGSDQTFDVSQSFNSLDLSLLFGGGVSFDLGSGGTQLFADAGYALGLVNVENTTVTGVSETLASRDVRIAAGVLFPLQ